MVPSPTCPNALAPQHRTAPPDTTAQVWSMPAATAVTPEMFSAATGVGPADGFAVPICPDVPNPQHHTCPPRLTQVCPPLTVMAVAPVKPCTATGVGCASAPPCDPPRTPSGPPTKLCPQ